MSVARQVPLHYREIFSDNTVQSAVRRLAAQLAPWALDVERQTGQQVLGLCILRGAFLFFADLLKGIPISIQPAFIQCQSYSTADVLQPEDGVQVHLAEFNCAGRHVLLVDDICDSGRTLAFVQARLRARQAAEIRTCVLIHRRRPDSVFTPDLAGFHHDGPEWFVGYGMDDRHRFMNYPAIYVIGDAGA